MARTIVAIYDDFQTANNAVRELVDNGIPRDNISLIANNRGDTIGGATTTGAATTGESVADETGAGAGVGAGIGAAVGGIGGLLIGLGALTIPGIGPVLAAGPLAVALSTLTGAGVGAVAGGVTGGLLGALIGLGIPEEEAEFYVEGVRRGGVLVTVQGEDFNTNHIMDVLNSHNPVDINERAAAWRSSGWQGAGAGAVDTDMDTDLSRHTHSGAEMGMDQDVTPVMDDDLDRQRGTWQTSGTFNDLDVTDRDYHEHYETNLAHTGYPYDYYAPAYQYGYGLASDARYQNRSWDLIEIDVQRDWENEHPGTWDRFKAAIQHAWEDITGQQHNH